MTGGRRRRPARAGKTRARRDDDPIGIVGLGLLGGSLARALSERFPDRPLIGVEPAPRNRARARRDGIFAKLTSRPSADLSSCEIVVLCAPAGSILGLLGPVSHWMRDGAILTDTGGVKTPILSAARRHVRRGVSFVGGHPMVGGETGGYGAARAGQWKGGVVALCSGGDRKSLGEVARLYRCLGSRIVVLTGREHDRAVAAVSHLPYVIASALALVARNTRLAPELAARGLRDATRLAAFAFDVQGEAARRNGRLPAAAASFQRTLASLLRGLAGKRPPRRAFARARSARKFLEAGGR